MVDNLPPKLCAFLEEISQVDPDTRAEMLIELADTLAPVPEEIATRPFPESAKVPGCESEVFAFAGKREDGTRDFFFAVENPQGISAKAMAAIIQETLNGADAEEIAKIPEDVAYAIFGRTLSMGKGQGLMSMIAVVKALSKR